MDDNPAIEAAVRSSRHVVLAFVLEKTRLENGDFGAPIVQAFFSALEALQADVRTLGSDLALLEGDPAHLLVQLAEKLGAGAVFYNEDYEPCAIERDARVTKQLAGRGIQTVATLEHVYFGSDEIAQGNAKPYRVFTPYKRQWLERLAVSRKSPVRSAAGVRDKLLGREKLGESLPAPLPEQYGHKSSQHFATVSERSAQIQLRRFLAGPVRTYAADRDYPARAGTSHLSPHLRAGTIGIRTCVEAALSTPHSEVWISELIWRDFYQMILRTFPSVVNAPFIAAASRIPWRDAPSDFAAWCEGRTGYPLVDAAMVQLNTTGWMHNRLRMVVASFLSKHLLIDWRLGERYFERHLSDADVAANNGGWQWSASTGSDAVPYFRVFNPVLQSKRFDPDGTFIKSMLPQFAGVAPEAIHEPWKFPLAVPNYPPPLVDHTFARERALQAYAVLKKGA
ncbi:MAG: deoxyribodipyrimidine photo-lyase [Vulcanimicrobiaceae bacterium]